MTKTELIAEGWTPHSLDYLSDWVFTKGVFGLSIMKEGGRWSGEIWISKWLQDKGGDKTPVRIYAGLCPDVETLKYLSKLLKIS